MITISIVHELHRLIAEDDGRLTIDKQDVANLLDNFESNLDKIEPSNEHEKLLVEDFLVSKRNHKAQIFTQSIEQYKVANSSGQSALRANFLMNGGGSIAVAAFIGTLQSSGKVTTTLVSDLYSVLLQFAIGVFFSAIAYGLTYLTMFVAPYDDESDFKRKLATILNYGSIIFGLGSLITFAIGLILASKTAF